jgi:hypothetical protein
MSLREAFIDAAMQQDTDECILWPFAVRKSSGYGAHSFYFEGKNTNIDVHRYVCARVNGPARKGEEAAHSCGQKLCINRRHIRWATHLENMNDAKAHQTLKGGGRGRQRFFAAELRDLRTSGASHIALGAKYGVEPAYIGKLRRGLRQ